ncbi:MAG: twin-arginine translocase TatA/TatE family subunit [Desulfobulbaceae bacterium]|uniref:Sec-independent protein translocase protein TatB homolog n=1 Tax=Candidatus Desulfatifera sulfidica TaxID=2841691 RepID=A0A8J6NA74_9BACT|nr:twin-arginine translocase TatA/TatE family subunit [Candidatus Desulfatifera sulfidica]
MFGIGLPEMILIMALALIVVGPDKLPDLARSVAKGILELKKTANSIKENLTEEADIIKDIKPDLEQAAKDFRKQVLEAPDNSWQDLAPGEGVNPPAEISTGSDAQEPIIADEISEPISAQSAQSAQKPESALPDTGQSSPAESDTENRKQGDNPSTNMPD